MKVKKEGLNRGGREEGGWKESDSERGGRERERQSWNERWRGESKIQAGRERGREGG